MYPNRLISDEGIMQISTRFAKDPNFEKYRKDAIDLVKRSKDFNEIEKKELLSILNQIGLAKSFKNQYIGFN